MSQVIFKHNYKKYFLWKTEICISPGIVVPNSFCITKSFKDWVWLQFLSQVSFRYVNVLKVKVNNTSELIQFDNEENQSTK